MKKYLNTISAFQGYQLFRYAMLTMVGVVFTKTSLSQGAIGEYETFLFLAGAVSFFWLNGLMKALLPLSSKKGSLSSGIFNAFVIIQLFSVLAAALIILFKYQFSEHLLNGNKVPEIKLLCMFIVFGVPANLVQYFYLIKKQSRALIVYAVISITIQFILVVLPIVAGKELFWALSGLTLSSVLKYFWLWFIMIRHNEIKLSRNFIREHMKLGLPLVAAAFLSGSAQYVDGFIVSSRFDEETFALFRYGAREFPLVVILANALSNAMLPQFGVEGQLDITLKKLKSSVTRLMHFLFPLTALLLLVSKPLFPILFNEHFTESATIFNLYLLLITSRLLMPQTILNGLKITTPIVQASFIELSLNVTLSLILVVPFGIAGIAFATLIAFLLEKIFLIRSLQIKQGIRLPRYLDIKLYAFYSTGVIVIFIFTELFI